MSVPIGMRLRAAERKAQLLGVARRLFARDGYRGASMESIAEAAGVTKPVLYQHFPSKRALYEALLASELGRLTEELETAFSQAEDNEQRLRRGFGAYLDFVDRHEDAFRLLFTEALGLAAYRWKLAIFVVAGLVAGLAGALAANLQGYVSPNALHWTQSGTLMVMVILGGVATVWGGAVGALVLLVLEEALSSWTEHAEFWTGFVLLAVVLFARQGLVGLWTAPRGRTPR